MKPNLFVILSFCLFAIGSLHAQEPQDSTKVVVTTYDGKERLGVILEDNGREILLMTDLLGKIYIRKEHIKSIKPATDIEMQVYDGDYRFSGPFTTRYYFTTNSLPIKKNDDYAMIHLYGPEVHFSVTNRFSVGIMTSWIASPFVLALKHTFPTKREKVNLGIGTLFGSSGYLNTFRGFGGLHWGMVTFGDRFNNLTIAAGYAYVDVGFEADNYDAPGTYYTTQIPTPGGYYVDFPEIPQVDKKDGLVTTPVLSIGGIAKVGKKASFIFDSMFFFASQKKHKSDRVETYDSNGYTESITYTLEPYTKRSFAMYLMPGMRFQKSDNTAFQFALAGLTFTEIGSGDVNAFPIPMCSWFFKF